jgi:hypothetical protein
MTPLPLSQDEGPPSHFVYYSPFNVDEIKGGPTRGALELSLSSNSKQ